MTSESRAVRRWAGAASVLAVSAGAMVLMPGTAKGDVGAGELSFTASAAADPFRISTKLANFPATDTPVDSGGPSAQAALSTSGGGIAYSASPDPGVFLSVLPQLGKGVLEQNGVAFPFAAPDYPFAIQATDQTPSKRVGAGGYELAADVTPTAAESRTRTGAQTPGGNVGLVDAAAQVVRSTTGVTAKAVSDIQGFTVGPLSVGSVRSVVSVVADASGSLTRNGTFSVDGLKIGDLPVGLAPGGFTVLGQPVPGDQAAMLNGLLEAGGVTLEQFPQTETENGLVGAGLIITQIFDTPTFGATTIRYRIGGAAADLNASGSEAAVVAPAAETVSVTGTPPASPGEAAGGSPAGGLVDAAALPAPSAAGVVPIAAGGLPATSGAVPSAAGVAAQAAGAAAPDPARTPGAGPAEDRLVRVSSATIPERIDVSFYLVLVLAGLLGLGVTRVVRMTG